MKYLFKLQVNLIIILCLFLSSNGQSFSWTIKSSPVSTRWTTNLNPNNVLPEYPRPQMVRENWQNLNGLWQYTITPKDATTPSAFADQILVPFPLESALSGVKKPLLPTQNLWYKRTFVQTPLKNGEHVLLHFGAVDWQATVYVNGKETGTHVGGYQSFSQDITAALKDGENEIVVKVFDPTSEGVGPHGKQVLNPANIYYTPSSGIWQTVWMEIIPAAYIAGLTLTPDVDKNVLNVSVNASAGTNVELIATDNGTEVSKIKGKAGVPLKLPVKNAKLWSPASPFLYDLTVKLSKGGKTVDEVKSYFGMRKIAIQKDEKGVDRIFLNNKPYFNLGTLDQGFWPDGLYTAPSDSALIFDIEAIKAMGFNTIRKHIKVEPARWYYHTDKLGMLVWQDFVNPNQGLPEGAKAEYEKETKETLEQLHNYPSITTWVIFNEKWGAYDQQRITEWIKTADPSRIVNGHSGEMLYVNKLLRSPSPNAYISSDIIDIHSYPYPMSITNENGKATVLGEFGGIGVAIEGHVWNDLATGWGYDGLGTPENLHKEYSKMIDTLIRLKANGLSGAIYTQPFDVESEQNGLITYDRQVAKLPLSIIDKINSKLTSNNKSYTQTSLIKALTVADTTNKSYISEVETFKSNKGDSLSLRVLSFKSLHKKDTSLTSEIVKQYLSKIKTPLSIENISYITKMTFHTTDLGFDLINLNREKINTIMGKDFSESFLMNIIFNDEIKPILNSKEKNWKIIEDSLVKKHGDLAQEKLNSVLLIEYFQKSDWQNYSKYYKQYFEKFLKTGRNNLHINNLTWPIFEHIDNLEILNLAEKVMKFNIENFDQSEPDSFDTYANILYKLGKKKEAMAWEEKALELSKNDSGIKNNYEKMKNDIKTWK